MKISFEIMPNAIYEKGDEITDVITDIVGKRSPLYQIIEKNGFSKTLKTKKIALIAEASFGKTTMMTDLRIKLMKLGEIFFSVSLFDFQNGKHNIDNLLNNAKDAKYALIDGLDEVDFSHRQTAEEVVRKIEESGNFTYIIVASRYLPKKTMGGFKTDFLKEYDVITLEPLGDDKIKALAEKLSIRSTSFVYTLLSVPMYATMAMIIFAHNGSEIFDKITDEASYTNTYFEALSLEKDKEFKVKRSGCSWEKIYEAAYETLRKKSFKKTDITIPVSINSLVSIVENGEGRCYLKCSSIRFLNFLAAKHIINEFIYDHKRCILGHGTVKYLLDFVFESDNVECLRFCGELLRHESERYAIIEALNADELKQDTDWYFNLCLMMLGYLPQVDDNVFALGNVFPAMYCKRIHKYAKQYFSYGQDSPWYLVPMNKSQYAIKVEKHGVLYFGSERNPYECVIVSQNNNWAIISSRSSFIASRAFYHCSTLENIEIPDGVTTIGDYAFDGCRSLKSIIIPDSVTSIGFGAFYDCTKLKSATISSGVTSIDDCAFLNCKSLESITIPDSVTSIGDYAFSNCTSLTNITVDVNNQIYKSIEGNLYTKDGKILIQYASAKIDRFFTIPDSVTYIGDRAFYRCDSLKSVIIPDSVINIGDSAFSGCESLESITIPDSVTSIGDYAFSDCTNLKSATILSGATSIGYSAFSGCESLESITIPDSVTSIGDRAFNSCSNLTSVTIGNSVTSIGDWAFNSCSNLTSVTIGNSVTSIGDYAFSDCTNLKSATISSGVTSIGRSAFSGCESLESITIPDSVTSIVNWAFSGCSALENIVLPKGLSVSYLAFSNCQSLKTVYYKGQMDKSDILKKIFGSAAIYYYSEECPDKPGDYWHYVNGTPTVW